MNSNRLKKTFEKVSDVYNSARASYPEELIKDVINISNIEKEGKILEIGCGSGNATHLFAKKGYSILGIDIGDELINLAKQNTSKFKNASYKKISFEDFKFKPNYFNLIFSAQAWHWLNPNIAYKKAHNLLTNNGYLSLFWKTQEYNKLDFLKELKKLYIKYCPEYRDPMAVKSAEKKIPKSGLFYPVKKKEYFVELEYNKEKYFKMVSTMSWVIDLPDNKKEIFNLELSDLLEKQDEIFLIPYRYTLLITKRL